ncbi:hypothetical protein D9758_003517 [Tetrapyrgos nigripes]|uniref:Uncharacterized protein n=1 Tax=Tetrapyrgos nigripes TaxID=182062 RepID=A0A8H5LVJ3_9AGAR|nr:hypothetical protein D9758_003517 [Tetrapyrgos nigripes]
MLFSAASIPSSLWSTTLTRLVVDLKGGLAITIPDDRPSMPLTSFIHPLYTLHGLREVNISLFADQFYVADGDIIHICTAWPDLIELLHIEPETKYGGLPTVECLPILARGCPRLKTLNLPFEVKIIPGFDQNKNKDKDSSPPPSPHKLPHKLAHLTLNLPVGDFNKCTHPGAEHLAKLAYHLDVFSVTANRYRWS